MFLEYFCNWNFAGLEVVYCVLLMTLRVEQTIDFKKHPFRTNTENLFEAGELIAKY
jgi:hypothetical protein